MSWLSFLIEYARHPRKVGAVAPSSPALVEAMLEPVDWNKAKTIVEFGPGTGVITKGILAKLRKDATLTSFETNKTFYTNISRLKDSRFTVRNQSAEMLDFKADAIISGLPLLAFGKTLRKNILLTVRKQLSDKGVFIQFQYTSKLESVLHRFFPNVKRTWVAKNIPPAFVYECRK